MKKWMLAELALEPRQVAREGVTHAATEFEGDTDAAFTRWNGEARSYGVRLIFVGVFKSLADIVAWIEPLGGKVL